MSNLSLTSPCRLTFALIRRMRPFRPVLYRQPRLSTKERIFANSWICVAHGSEVARPNDYITREIIGENIVIVRGRDTFCAPSITSAHRGHQLLSGEGKAKRDYLPLSRRAFKLDGNLAHARNCENVANFDSEKATQCRFARKSMPALCLSI